MALEVEGEYPTCSGNVVLHDSTLETYNGVDVRSCGGVQFDVYLICDIGGGPVVDLLSGFQAIIVVSMGDGGGGGPLSIDHINTWGLGVTFRHVGDPEHFATNTDDGWRLLALDLVEWFMKKKVVRRSRYGRDLLI